MDLSCLTNTRNNFALAGLSEGRMAGIFSCAPSSERGSKQFSRIHRLDLVLAAELTSQWQACKHITISWTIKHTLLIRPACISAETPVSTKTSSVPTEILAFPFQ